MTDEARTGAGAAAYRGFLFSDLRGFTAYAERHGNAAAAATVGRFLEISRTAIAQYDGAEMMTEGDAIHAVFPSASGAVLCGLAIQDAATELNATEPDRAIGVGVGVHAGEAVETAEGYIGRAVNIAARLCAIAKPGEVLVSSTVKGITQASIPVGFIPRGRRRLKGIHDPIVVYAITRDMTATAGRGLSRPMVLGAAGVAVAVVVLLAAVVGSNLLTSAGATPSTAATPTATVSPAAHPVAIGGLPIGTYKTQQFQPPVTFDIVDLGWAANRDAANMLGLIRDTAPPGGLSFLHVQEVIANPCVQGGEGAQTSPADLITELSSLAHLTVSNPESVEVAGYVGRQVDVTVADAALAACGGLAGGDVALFAVGDEVWRAVPGERFRLISIDAGRQPLTIVMSTDWTQTPSVHQLEDLLALGQRILDSVEL